MSLPSSPKPALLFLLAAALAANAASQDTTIEPLWQDNCPPLPPSPSPSPSPLPSPLTPVATNSTFWHNIRTLLDALPSAASPTGFASLSGGECRDRAFVRGLCRGDSDPVECHANLTTAVLYVHSHCNSSRRAAVWYEKCFVSYADTNASTAVEEDYRVWGCDSTVLSDPTMFEQTYSELTKRLLPRAANGSGGRMFATGEASYAPGGTMYGLVQCMRDRTAAECGRCLEKSMRELPEHCWGNQGGIVLAYNCFLQFDIYAFYDLALDAPPPVSPGPSSSRPFTGERRDSGKNRTNTILAASLSLGAVVILVLVFGVSLQRRRIMVKRPAQGGSFPATPYFTVAAPLTLQFGSLPLATVFTRLRSRSKSKISRQRRLTSEQL